MTLLIGTPLPEPFFTRVMRPDQWGGLRVRRCRACNLRWATVEIALVDAWPEGFLATECPVTRGVTAIASQKHITHYQGRYRGKWPCHGEMTVYQFGGIWRRRKCAHCMACGHSLRLHGKVVGGACKRCDCNAYEQCMHKGKERRWTTGEFSANGIVVADIAKCPECGCDRTRGSAPNSMSVGRHLRRMRERVPFDRGTPKGRRA